MMENLCIRVNPLQQNYSGIFKSWYFIKMPSHNIDQGIHCAQNIRNGNMHGPRAKFIYVDYPHTI